MSLLQKHSDRAYIYKNLSECFYLPNEKLPELIDGLNETLCELFPQIVKFIPNLDEDIEALKIDFSRLFVGPFELPSPPYGSIYLENSRKIMGDSTIDVIKIYREEGLDIKDEVPDHIAIELEFMYFLIYKEIRAIEKSDQETSVIYSNKQEDFLKIHLGKWVPKFSEAVINFAQVVFYKDLARLTRLFIEEDIKFITNKTCNLSILPS